jgi:hypothetical protein
MKINNVIEAAKIAHKKYWLPTSDESTGDKQAAAVTKAWQSSVASDRIKYEVPIMENLNEKIDVIDLSTGTAYEMKVSKKNPHHEFYKDIFKVVIYNQHHEKKVKHLVFLTEKDGAEKLRKGLGKAVTESVNQYNLSIEIVAI